MPKNITNIIADNNPKKNFALIHSSANYMKMIWDVAAVIPKKIAGASEHVTEVKHWILIKMY